MERLTRRDLRGVLKFLREDYSFDNRRAFIDHIFEKLGVETRTAAAARAPQAAAASPSGAR